MLESDHSVSLELRVCLKHRVKFGVTMKICLVTTCAIIIIVTKIINKSCSKSFNIYFLNDRRNINNNYYYISMIYVTSMMSI